MIKLFFSIVIANYNCGKYLDSAIQSVLSQDCDDFELLIVDGGSSDESLEIISKYEDQLGWWVSEKDSGQSEAFNKGFRHAKGKFLSWLNADDLMLPGTLAAVKRKLERHPAIEWATGNMIRFNQRTGRIIEVAWGPHIMPHFLQGNGFPLCIYGPTSFWSRESYNRIGPIDESLHYTMDYDYWRRMSIAGLKYVRVNHTCWAFRMHEESKTAEFDDHVRSDACRVKMEEENKNSIERTGYYVSVWGKISKQIFRIIDGSFIVFVYRSIFLLDKPLKRIYSLSKIA